MKDFLKVAWIDEHAKNYWRDKINSFQAIYNRLEYDSIGVSRQAAIISVDPFDLPELSKKVADKGWWLHILSANPSNIAYSNAETTAQRGEQIVYRVLISIKHFGNYDDYTLGRYLGYPFCCIHDFEAWWGSCQDHTPRLFAYKQEAVIHSTLYRHLGIRFVRHLPCSVGCVDSKHIAQDIFNTVISQEPSTGLAVKNFILQEAVYSRLHGIAEVKTPVVKFAYNTDYTPTEEAFFIPGKTMVRFNEREYKDNGFSSAQAQDRAHDPIILNILYIMRDLKNPNPKVIDYGCGNGALLEKIQTLFPNVNVAGIDLNDSALRSAEEKLPAGQFHLGNLYTRTIAGCYDVGMVSIKRLHDNPELAHCFIDYERNHSVFTIFYDYDNGGSVGEQLKQYYTNFKVYHTYRNNACEATTVRW